MHNSISLYVYLWVLVQGMARKLAERRGGGGKWADQKGLHESY